MNLKDKVRVVVYRIGNDGQSWVSLAPSLRACFVPRQVDWHNRWFGLGGLYWTVHWYCVSSIGRTMTYMERILAEIGSVEVLSRTDFLLSSTNSIPRG
jgi:hypothetical protein